jgi:hypothetical protein
MIRCTSPIFRFVFVVLLFVVGFGPRSSAEMIDQRNFAIDTYYPTPNEIQLPSNERGTIGPRTRIGMAQILFILLLKLQRFSKAKLCRIFGPS